MPNENINNNADNIVLNGTTIAINVAITINGPNGMYSSVFFIFVANKNMLIIAQIKNKRILFC